MRARQCNSQLGTIKRVGTKHSEKEQLGQPTYSRVSSKRSKTSHQKTRGEKENWVEGSVVVRKLEDRLKDTLTLPISLTPPPQETSPTHPVLAEVTDYYLKQIDKLQAEKKIG